MEGIIAKAKRKKRNGTNDLWYRIVIVIGILGGAYGAILTAASLPPVFRNSSFLMSSIYLVFWGLYVLSSIAGIMLWQGKSLGLTLSLPLLALQIMQFTIGRLSYRFVVGIEATPYLNSDGVEFNALLTSRWQFDIWSQNNSFAIGINLVALFSIAIWPSFYLTKTPTTAKGFAP